MVLGIVVLDAFKLRVMLFSSFFFLLLLMFGSFDHYGETHAASSLASDSDMSQRSNPCNSKLPTWWPFSMTAHLPLTTWLGAAPLLSCEGVGAVVLAVVARRNDK